MDSQDPGSVTPVDPALTEFAVLTQKLELEIDFPMRSLTGTTILEIQPLIRDLKSIKINARQCVIPLGDIRVDGKPCEVEFEDRYRNITVPGFVDWSADNWECQKDKIEPLLKNAYDPELTINLPAGFVIREANVEQLGTLSNRADIGPALTSSSKNSDIEYLPIQILIPFSVKDFRDGLHFVGLEDGDLQYPHVYTQQASISSGISRCIFPCFDNPKVKPLWMISIKCGRTLGDALTRSIPNATTGRGTHTSNGTSTVSAEKTSEGDHIGVDTEAKLLEMAVVCSGDVVKDIIDPADTTKKIVSFEVAGNMVGAGHIAFAVGPFEYVNLSDHRTDEDNRLGQKAVKVNAYCLPGRSAEVNNAAQPLALAIDTFCMNYGAYPFTDYTVCFVADQIEDTVDSASLTLCSERLLHPEEIIDELLPVSRKLIHALARQYFGVSILPDKPGDTWLVVGIAYFIMDLFMSKLCGNNEYRFDMKKRADRLMTLDKHRPSLHELGGILDLGSFEVDFMGLKAPLVLHMLDQRMAKKSGSSGLTRVISKLFTTANTGTSRDDGRTLTTDGFQKICEKFGHMKLHDFFQQWVFNAGFPRFQISQKFDKKNLRIKMSIKQVQGRDLTDNPNKLDKNEFAREVKEDANHVYESTVLPKFTGPMTIRIHEADGTPYEHIIEIDSRETSIEIPYNTKYKRFRRNRQQKERENAATRGDNMNIDGPEDILLYCLGDVLQSEEDMQEWKLTGWDQETLTKMDGESFEWISIDADHEWTISAIDHTMEPYMFSSQLQQDRDVVAHINALKFMARCPPSEIISSILIRTVMDSRYFHGVRTMAAEILALHATASTNWIGKFHLEKAFKKLFCYPATRWTPLPNDFRDWQAYKLQIAIATAMSKIRDEEGNCPLECRKFIFDQLRLNDNSDNLFSDSFYVASLLKALTDSMIKIKTVDDDIVAFAAEIDDDEREHLRMFQDDALEEIERYQKIDQTMGSWKNAYTRAVLDSKKRLMKSGAITSDHREFLAYLQDETYDLVQVEAMSALVDLGMLFKFDGLIAFFVNLMATTISPFVRDQFYQIFWRGLASLAFGEYIEKQADAADDGLVIFQGQEQADARVAKIARSTSIAGALSALKNDLKDNQVLKLALWDAVKSPFISLGEQMTLLEFCSILYDSDPNFRITLQYPRYWSVHHLGKVKRPILYYKPKHLSLVFSDSQNLPSTPSKSPSSLPNVSFDTVTNTPKTPSNNLQGVLIFTKTGKIRTKMRVPAPLPAPSVTAAPLVTPTPISNFPPIAAPISAPPPPVPATKKTKAAKTGDMRAPAKPKPSAPKQSATPRPATSPTSKRASSVSSNSTTTSHSQPVVVPPVLNLQPTATPTVTPTSAPIPKAKKRTKIVKLYLNRDKLLKFPISKIPSNNVIKASTNIATPTLAAPVPAPVRTLKLTMKNWKKTVDGALDAPDSRTPTPGANSIPASTPTAATKTPLPDSSGKIRKLLPDSAPKSKTKLLESNEKVETPLLNGNKKEQAQTPVPKTNGNGNEQTHDSTGKERKKLPDGRKPLPDGPPKNKKKRKEPADAEETGPPRKIIKLMVGPRLREMTQGR